MRTRPPSSVGLDAYAADVQLALVKPHDGGGQFLGELGGHQDDAHVPGEPLLVGLVPAEESQQRPARVIALAQPIQVLAVDLHGPLERHGGYHRGVADGLKLHVAAVLRPLQLEDDEVGVLVHAQQVDAPARVLPVAELLGDDEGVRGDDLDLLAEQPLEVSPLL
jgi:hypothetical protein